MSQENGRRFQSGREVFETFIPGFTRKGSSPEGTSVRKPAQSTATELVDKLLREFSKALLKKS